MRDPRIDEYARMLVDRSVVVQPGWQVLVRASHLARPLVESVLEQIAGRGAYSILQLSFEQTGGPFAREAPLELLREPAPLLRRREDRRDDPPRGRQFYSFTGGSNVSSIHWDIVKDLRVAGQLYADGRLVQENGVWLL